MGKIEPILMIFCLTKLAAQFPQILRTSYGAQNRQKVDKFGVSLSVCTLRKVWNLKVQKFYQKVCHLLVCVQITGSRLIDESCNFIHDIPIWNCYYFLARKCQIRAFLTRSYHFLKPKDWVVLFLRRLSRKEIQLHLFSPKYTRFLDFLIFL